MLCQHSTRLFLTTPHSPFGKNQTDAGRKYTIESCQRQPEYKTKREKTKMRVYEAQQIKVGDTVTYLHVTWNWKTNKAEREIQKGKVTRIECLFNRYFYIDNGLTPQVAETLIEKVTV
jgi:aryl-phospho-beta-D-glucosidase BglC (GH1 family)